MVGDISAFGMVWYHPEGISHIPSMSSVKARLRVTFDNNKDTEFIVHTYGCQHWFTESNQGLYYTNMSPKGTVLGNTVATSKSKYTNHDYSRVVLARKILRIIGCLSEREFRKIIANEQLKNYSVTTEEAHAVRNIFGPDVGSLQEKQARQTLHRVVILIANILSQIMRRYCQLTLCMDIMIVNNIPFLSPSALPLNLGPLKY